MYVEAEASYVAGFPVPLPLPPGPPVRLDQDARAESQGLARPPFEALVCYRPLARDQAQSQAGSACGA